MLTHCSTTTTDPPNVPHHLPQSWDTSDPIQPLMGKPKPFAPLPPGMGLPPPQGSLGWGATSLGASPAHREGKQGKAGGVPPRKWGSGTNLGIGMGRRKQPGSHLDVPVHRRAGCQPLGFLGHGASRPPAAEGCRVPVPIPVPVPVPAPVPVPIRVSVPAPAPVPPRRPGSQGGAAERAEPAGEPHAAAARPRGALPAGLRP